jgi:hypothetical protein
MPSKRTPLHRARHPKITPEALAVWRRCCELERQGATEGGEYSDLGKRLCTLTGCDWCSMQWPTTATSPTLPAYLRGRELQTADYWAAYRARLALIEAEAAADRAAEAENEQRPGPTT